MNRLTVGLIVGIVGLVGAVWVLPVATSHAQTIGGQPGSALGPDFDKLLKKKLWIIETRAAPGAPDNQVVLRAHMYHQRDLEKQGIMFGAGPVTDAKGQFEYGMIIIRAASREEAQKIADSDPMHIAKLRTYTLHEWMLNEGQMRISVNFSDGTYRFE